MLSWFDGWNLNTICSYIPFIWMLKWRWGERWSKCVLSLKDVENLRPIYFMLCVNMTAQYIVSLSEGETPLLASRLFTGWRYNIWKSWFFFFGYIFTAKRNKSIKVCHLCYFSFKTFDCLLWLWPFVRYGQYLLLLNTEIETPAWVFVASFLCKERERETFL